MAKDPDRVRGGYKAIATSVGIDNWQKVKRYMNSEAFKKAIADAKKRSKLASNPDAYLASVERRIVAGHFGTSEGIENILDTLNAELGEVSETVEKEGDKYSVYSEKGHKKLGTHKTKKKAEKQLAAIHISQHR